MSTGVPAHNPPLDAALAMSPHDTTVSYTAGNFRATLGTPRLVFQSITPAHFSGMNLFANGNILLRVNTGQDSDQVPGSMSHVLSTNSGQTFPSASLYTVATSHTSAEPIAPCPDGAYRGSSFTYFTYPYLGDVTKCANDFQTIDQNGARHTPTTNGSVFSGLPRLPITGDDSALGYSTHISFFTDIIVFSDTNWIGGLNVQFVGDSYFTILIMRSADHGATWTYVSTVNPIGPGDAEHSLTLLPNGTTIVCFSRALGGDSFLYRWVSTDSGLTWGSRAVMNAWGKAPRAALINDSTADGVLLSGIAPYSTDPYPYGLALRFTSDLTTGGTTSGAEWPSVDLVAHHNAMISDSQYKFLPGGLPPPSWRPHSSSYCSIVRLANNSLLINYDERALYDGDSTRLTNRIWVVNVAVARIS